MALIKNISDTARWVAAYRALESERSDAIFSDPYARRLAGEVGFRIVDKMPRGRSGGWAIVVRTKSLDEMIQRAIDRGVRTVVNLAAGLDSRPYRLALPSDLTWIEVDLPALLDYKTELLAGETPTCRLERISVDLADAGARANVLDRIAAETPEALVITEGLLVYLTADQVAALARDLRAHPSFRWWLFDLGSPQLLKMLESTWGKTLEEGNAPLQFGPAEGPKFFEPYGWRTSEERSTLEEGERLKRQPAGAWLYRIFKPFVSAEKREMYRTMCLYVLLEQAT